jgi:DNA-binding transcriptional ArsR family regulator
MKHSEIEKVTQQRIFQMQCDICRALGHPIRMAIVDQLKDRETPAADLIKELEISKASLSKHMSLLIQGGIVEARRDGRQIFYRLTDPDIQKACAIMSSILYRRLRQGEKLASAIGATRGF